MFLLVIKTNPKLQYKISISYLLAHEFGPSVNHQQELSLHFLYRIHISNIFHF